MPDIIPHQQQPEQFHKFYSLKGGNTGVPKTRFLNNV